MQTVSTAFKNISTASFNQPVHSFKVSWLRNTNASADFAIVGTSLVGGFDLVKGETDIISLADLFEYFDESDYVVSCEIERVVEEPLGGISYAIANIILENTSKRFTRSFNSTIGTALLPKRPLKINLGYKVNGIDKAIPKFKGLLSNTPQEDKIGYEVRLKAFDYLNFIDNKQLASEIYIDKRSDEIIEDILIDAGFSASQYSLDTGLNKIGFAWFTKGETAGKRIRKICEAEEAHFFQDENGLLRFQTRRRLAKAPYNSSVHTVNAGDIISWSEDNSIERINRCKVVAKPRTIKAQTVVWESLELLEVPANSTIEYWIYFENPVTSLATPVAGTDFIFKPEISGGGASLTSNISISVDLLTTDAKLTITNSGARGFFVDSLGNPSLQLRGTPATIDSEIEQIYEDLNSQAKYGETKELVIQNDFIDNSDFAKYMARAIVEKYSDYMKRIRITIPAIPHLQLKDFITVYDPDTLTSSSYRVVSIIDKQRGASYIQDLILREITDTEAENEAIVDISTVDGNDVVAS